MICGMANQANQKLGQLIYLVGVSFDLFGWRVF